MAPSGKVAASTEFQRQRLTEAVSAARFYLGSDSTVGKLARSLGMTGERAAQIIRLGIKYMVTVGWLKPALDEKKTSRRAP